MPTHLVQLEKMCVSTGHYTAHSTANQATISAEGLNSVDAPREQRTLLSHTNALMEPVASSTDLLGRSLAAQRSYTGLSLYCYNER